MSEVRSQKSVVITGAAGYIGAMLCDQFSKRDDVREIIALDKEDKPELLTGNEKIFWITANLGDGVWQNAVAARKPDIVIHTAWQIREMYGKRRTQWHWNIGGSYNVFTFAFRTPSVRKFIHFSTAAVYGALRSNRLDCRFREDDRLREREYSYGREKLHAEELLRKTLRESQKENGAVSVFVLRPAAITGPRGRYMRTRFGIQSALSGQLQKDFVYKIISLMVSFVPATRKWVRQFIHEDDVCDITALLAFEKEPSGGCDTLNITPPGEPVYAPQMAEAVGKRVIGVAPWMVRIAYFFFWHATRGKIPVSRGIWRFYSYPIVMDGSKLTNAYGYEYRYSSRDAFQYTNGRYEPFVPQEKQNNP